MDFYFNSWRDILFAKLARPPQILCAKRFLYIPNNDTNNLSAPISLFPSFKKILFFRVHPFSPPSGLDYLFSTYEINIHCSIRFILFCVVQQSLKISFFFLIRILSSFNTSLFVASEDQSTFDI